MITPRHLLWLVGVLVLVAAGITLFMRTHHRRPVPPASVAVQPPTLSIGALREIPSDRPARRPVTPFAVNGMPLIDRHLAPAERAAPLAPELLEAILRTEGIYDPTRIGYFGRALRMEIRAGTMSMSNVFADRWAVLSSDPNVHFRTPYLGRTWLWPPDVDCEGLRRFRPDESLEVFDSPSIADCQALGLRGSVDVDATFGVPVVAATLSLPVFAAPYPGSRLTHEELVRAQEAHARTVRERLRILERVPAK